MQRGPSTSPHSQFDQVLSPPRLVILKYSNVDVMWMLCGALWRNVNVMWSNVDIMWTLHISSIKNCIKSSLLIGQ